MNDHLGIPTTYRGVHFRSRLEARWAAFFDTVGWPWEYEPVDLAGYIPDFVLPFRRAPIIVEVKSCLTAAELEQHAHKIDRSGWPHEYLLVGARLLDPTLHQQGASLGLLNQRPDYGVDHALLQACLKCAEFSLFHETGWWGCMTNGCYDGNRYLRPLDRDEAHALWATAGNRVQWRPFTDRLHSQR